MTSRDGGDRLQVGRTKRILVPKKARRPRIARRPPIRTYHLHGRRRRTRSNEPSVRRMPPHPKPNGSQSNDFDRNRFVTGPTGPPLRANPSPEVTDRICRLPLSTFVYRQESPQLGDLMRILVRPVRSAIIFRVLFDEERTTDRTPSFILIQCVVFLYFDLLLDRVFKGRLRRARRHINRDALRRQSRISKPFLPAN